MPSVKSHDPDPFERSTGEELITEAWFRCRTTTQYDPGRAPSNRRVSPVGPTTRPSRKRSPVSAVTACVSAAASLSSTRTQSTAFWGMLFVYPEARVLSMWMKNTYIPLDILFIRADGTIANIATNTVPLSLESIPAIEPLNYALELNGGMTARLGIDTTSRVYLPEI